MKRQYFYVIYNLDDFPCYLCDDDLSLCYLTGIRKRDLNYFYNRRLLPYICATIDNRTYKVYRFLKEM